MQLTDRSCVTVLSSGTIFLTQFSEKTLWTFRDITGTRLSILDVLWNIFINGTQYTLEN